MDLQTLLFTAAMSFAVAVILGPLCIPLLRRLKVGQSIRAEGPQAHMKKSGTPTMGGIMTVIALAITAIKFGFGSSQIWLLLLVTIGFGSIGFLDDFIKVVLKRNLGLRAKQKMFGQILVAVVFYFILYFTGQLNTTISIPFSNYDLNFSWLYLPFLVFLVIGFSNAVNLTDGLDGLAAGTSAIAYGTYAVIAFHLSHYDIALFCAAMVGAVVGFLVFNIHPAKVFMGDTGSLAIGGGLAAVAILTKTEILLLLIGGIFVIETLSVMIQVFSFQTFGKRVFKMSPLHHHFELVGWTEWRVVLTFWLVEFVACLAAIAIYQR
ncbi:phospho-N-acetylmuramoyl-pentapeptide-transferase [Fodinisporobacter ferrooxydans]|uniref:Phospho-N-acetylmuramoyl-pentapeptide-transferase n=1 Tax=Fodinisporobacter ferrooxydans TaxID=2901836 RepID=A0ABY4CFL7_9BACL|nr:phospho-N-acetylmuramoyl-pentapeptide-transferase [Alicyclobacillaceae bacterium MYW30-H2]